MKLILSLFIASALFAAAPPAIPEIDQATQIDVLAHHFEILSAQAEAAPYIAAVKAAIASASPGDVKAAAQCNPDGGKKYQFELKDHKVVCSIAPPVNDTGAHLPTGGTVTMPPAPALPPAAPAASKAK